MTKVDLNNLTDSQHWDLSDLVHDVASQIASDVINSNQQVKFLLANGWTESDIKTRLEEKKV